MLVFVILFLHDFRLLVRSRVTEFGQETSWIDLLAKSYLELDMYTNIHHTVRNHLYSTAIWMRKIS